MRLIALFHIFKELTILYNNKMSRFNYYIKKTMERTMNYEIINKFTCICVPEGSILQEKPPADWTFFIQYQYYPSKENEIFELKLRFQSNRWNDVFEIKTFDEYKKQKELA